MQCLLEFDLLANRRRWQRKQDTLWVWQHLAPVVQHASSRRSSSSGHHFSAWNLKHTTVPRKIKENTTRATNVWRQAPRARHPRHGPSVTRGISKPVQYEEPSPTVYHRYTSSPAASGARMPCSHALHSPARTSYFERPHGQDAPTPRLWEWETTGSP
ncbi:uncharacterized protein LOC121834164 isoform X2 [Ixodes scapularis]|uniref:uncharacterized protein LOC121834164 isoform X2 n=1 Tax=Ixodes scapularis TaxID=6945 RepID=UPI001C385DD6|nr:uncharacterized protein LOC121834164 isoform X2 [Ixodes scapularis]